MPSIILGLKGSGIDFSVALAYSSGSKYRLGRRVRQSLFLYNILVLRVSSLIHFVEYSLPFPGGKSSKTLPIALHMISSVVQHIPVTLSKGGIMGTEQIFSYLAASDRRVSALNLLTGRGKQ